MRYFLPFFILLIFTSSVFGLDYYWVGGNGDWTDINHWATTSGGNLKHIQTPTPADDVYFDQNSGVSTVNVNMNIPIVVCKSFILSGLATNSVKFSGVTNQIRLYGNLALSSQAIWNISAIFSFESQTTNNVITSANCEMPFDMYFASSAGAWSLSDSLYSKKSIYLTAGSLNTNNQKLKAYSIYSKSTFTRSLILGGSIIEIDVLSVDGQGFTVNGGTSSIRFKGGSFEVVNCQPQTFYDLRFYKAAFVQNNVNLQFHDVHCPMSLTFTGNIVFDKLFLAKGNSYNFEANKQYTFLTLLSANGDCRRPISLSGGNQQAIFYKSTGTVSVSYVVMKYIGATGGATFNAYDTDDRGGNSGWNITPTAPRTLYWVGGSGVWEDSTHWSLSSNGIGGECVPTLKDDVFFDNNSFFGFADSIRIIDTAANCHDMTWQTTKQPRFLGDNSKVLKIGGSLFLCPNLSFELTGVILFVSMDNGEVVQSAGNSYVADFSFYGNGSWTLLDALETTKNMSLAWGELYTNSKYVNCDNFVASFPRWKELYLGASLIEVQGNVIIRQDSTFIDPGTSTIRLMNAKLLKTDLHPYRNLYNVEFMEDAILDSYYTHFHKIIYHKNAIKRNFLRVDSIFYSAGYDYQLSGVDTVNQYLHAVGYCTKIITFRAPIPKGIFSLVKTSGMLTVNHLHMRGIHATGGATFIAYNSSDLGMNSGWNFINHGTKLYWIGGDGSWTDSLHWSYSSGGIGGACIPTIKDSVYFDLNSGFVSGDTVLVSSPNAFCRDMHWSLGIDHPVFSTDLNSNLWVSGSLHLSSDMDLNYSGIVYFCDSTQGKTITSMSNDFDNHIDFIDNGSWALQDSMCVKNDIYHFNGSISTNSKPLAAVNYYANYAFPKSMNISNSKVYLFWKSECRWVWYQNAFSSFIATNSDVNMLATNKNFVVLSGQGSVNFHNIYFRLSSSTAAFTGSNSIQNFNNKVVFYCGGQISYDHQYDSLILSAGKSYFVSGNSKQEIFKYLKADGSCGKYLSISGSQNSVFSKATGIVDVHEVIMRNITATGGAVFNAYGGSDLGGNVNWNWYPNAARTLYWVGNTGIWNDSAHWSLSSGGPGGECVPTRIDDVIVDSNSCSKKGFSISTVGYAECLGFFLSQQPNAIIDGNINIYGGMNLSSKINGYDFTAVFQSDHQNNLVKTFNNVIDEVIFSGKGGWYLYDSLKVSDSITLNRGFLDTRGNYISSSKFNSHSGYAKKLHLHNSLVELDESWRMNVDSLSFDAGTSTINFREGAKKYLFVNTGKNHVKYHNVSILHERKGETYLFNYDSALIHFNKLSVFNNGFFYNQYVFDSLIFAPGNTYKLQDDMTQTVNLHWQIRGNNCYAINLESTKMFSTAYTTKPLGMVSGDFINMRDIHSGGNCTYYAGAFSTDISNNQGWLFYNGPNYVYGLGKDTNFSIGSNTVLNTVNFNGTSTTLYQWSTGSTHDTIVVNKVGWYYVTVTYASDCQVVDSIYVGCRIDVQYNVNHNPCFGDTLGLIQIIIPDTNYTYSFVWNTGDTTSTIQPYPAGNYILTIIADSGYCQDTDTVEIKQPPRILIPQGDTSFCEGDSVLLDAGNFQQFYWSDGLNNRYRWVANPDTFYLRVVDFTGCKSLGDTVKVAIDSIPYLYIGADTTVCLNEQILLKVDTIFDHILWIDGSGNYDMLVYYPGKYWVQISKGACTVSDTINIDACPPKLKMPNVFTPNSDGKNDKFLPEEANIVEFQMKIFTRWGLRVFQTDDIKNGWDGNVMGQPADEGVYFYIIEFREWLGSEAGPIITQQGSFTLLRNR